VDDIAAEIIDFENGELDDDEVVALFQLLIDNGMAWTLQGHYGRTARFFIGAGLCSEPMANYMEHGL